MERRTVVTTLASGPAQASLPWTPLLGYSGTRLYIIYGFIIWGLIVSQPPHPPSSLVLSPSAADVLSGPRSSYPRYWQQVLSPLPSHPYCAPYSLYLPLLRFLGWIYFHSPKVIFCRKKVFQFAEMELGIFVEIRTTFYTFTYDTRYSEMLGIERSTRLHTIRTQASD